MKTFEKISPKSHAEWLEERKKGIGSSEAATILGVNPFQTPYQLWRLKKGIDAPIEENFAMRAGHYLEDAVSRFFADETGAYIVKSSAGDWLLRNREKHFLQVSPDRFFYADKAVKKLSERRILECKTTRMKIDENDLPKHWFVQLQYQLGIAECDEGALAWLTAGSDFGYKRIVFDEKIFHLITGAIEEFWTRYIVGSEEPPVTTYTDVVLKYPHSTDAEIVASNDVIDNLATLKRVREQIRQLTDAETQAEESIKAYMKDNERLVLPNGETAATWKSAKTTVAFDYKRYEKEHADTIADYMIERQGSRRFIVK